MATTDTSMPTGRVVLLGVLGSALMAVGAVGAGGILVSDPIIGDGPLSWIRFGHGRMFASIVVYAGFALLVTAWVLLGRRAIEKTVDGRQVLTAAACWMAPLMLSPPLFTRDVWAYLAQGALLYGHDPYTSVPNALTNIPTILANVYPSWLSTPSPYGPLFLAVSKGIVTITGDNPLIGVLVTRVAMLPGLALMVWALRRLTYKLGGSQPVTMWLAVASPMTVVHLIGGPHNDILMLGLLTAGVLAALEKRHAVAVAVITLAMLMKPTAALALPFVVWIWANRLPSSKLVNFLRAGTISVAIFGAVFVLGTWASLGAFNLGWIGGLSGPLQIQNWLNFPTGLGQLAHVLTNVITPVEQEPFIVVARVIGAVVLAGIAVWQWWQARDGGTDAIWHAGVTLLAAALLAPPTLPWYLTWGFVILAAFAWTPRWLSYLVGVSVFLVLAFYPTGEQAVNNPIYMAGVFAVSIYAARALDKARPDTTPRVGRAPADPVS